MAAVRNPIRFDKVSSNLITVSLLWQLVTWPFSIEFNYNRANKKGDLSGRCRG